MYAAYDELIAQVLRAIPWSNITEITNELNRIRREQDINRERKLSKGATTRKTVRKHLKRMVRQGKTMKHIGLYGPAASVSGPSYKLNALVRRTLSRALRSKKVLELNFRFANDVAACYLATRPSLPRNLEIPTAVFELQAVRFARQMFWLEEIVSDALRRGHLSKEVCSGGKIDPDLLRRGLKRSFADTKLLVLLFALDLRQLLAYLKTPAGEAMAKRLLEDKWKSIEENSRNELLFSEDDKRLISWLSYDSESG
jgi:hypothetical protein